MLTLKLFHISKGVCKTKIYICQESQLKPKSLPVQVLVTVQRDLVIKIKLNGHYVVISFDVLLPRSRKNSSGVNAITFHVPIT